MFKLHSCRHFTKLALLISLIHFSSHWKYFKLWVKLSLCVRNNYARTPISEHIPDYFYDVNVKRYSKRW